MGFFNKKVFNFSKPHFGLDLSDLSVKVVQIEKNNQKQKVTGFGSAPIPLGSIIDGEIIKKEEVIFAIREALKKSGPRRINSKKAICSLPETKAFLRLISLPSMKEEEIKEAIKWEIEANIPLSADQVYYDWQVLEKKISAESSKKDILVIAVGRKIVDHLIEVLDEAGISVEGLEIESISQTRCLLSEKNEKETVMIVDIGDRRTSFSISVSRIPCFTCSVPLSSYSLTSAISKVLNLSFSEAEKTKMTYGIGSPLKNDPIFRSASPLLENLATELEKSIDFYLTGLRYSRSIDRIFLCGGGANTRGLVPYLSQRLDKEIEMGNPWINIKTNGKLPVIGRELSSQFVTAIGLALKDLRYENLS